MSKNEYPYFSVHRDIAHKFEKLHIGNENEREGCFTKKFAKHQKMPPGYTVEFWNYDEMYHFDIENIDFESPAYCDRFKARRAAWQHYNKMVADGAASAI